MLPDSQMCMFSNVHMKAKDIRTNRTLYEIHKKNRITKFALEGIAKMIRGSFNSTDYTDINNYVPKYIGLGTNEYDYSEGAEDHNIDTNVTSNDTGLLNEIVNNGNIMRIRLESVTQDNSSKSNDYIKLRCKAMVMSGFVSPSTKIQELGLFTDNLNLYGKLWARITVDPITIPDNSVLDITWDIILASSGIGIYPTSIELFNSDEENVTNNIDNPPELEVGVPYVISSSMKSSVPDGYDTKALNLVYERESEEGVLPEYGTVYNNILMPSNSISLDSSGNLEIDGVTKETGYQGTIPDYVESTMQIYDVDGNLVNNGGNATVRTFKEVTYKNCVWSLYILNSVSNEYEFIDMFYPKLEGSSYSEGEYCIYEDQVYIRNDSSLDDSIWRGTNWTAICKFTRYMTTCVVINRTDPTSLNYYEFKINAKAITAINVDTYFKIKK